MKSEEIHIITPRYDSFGLRNTNSEVTDVIQYENLNQIYKGPIVRGCYHGKGLIIWIQKNKKCTYEGYFYVNQIHGYGRMTYGNGLVFEGLYKNNMRFGPGVLTHPDLHQEVGFWVGTHIVRLCCNLTTHTVPSYDAPTVYTKIKLLQFKHIVNLNQPPHSIINVRDIKEKYLNEKYSLPYIRHLNSLFFDTQTFDHALISNSMIPKNNKEIINKKQFINGYNLEDLILNNYLKISKETSRSNKEFLLNCGFGIGNNFEHLSSQLWTIKNRQYKNKIEASEQDVIHPSHSNILAYNNNTLDKIILAHAYQQRFGEKSLLYNLNNLWNEKRSIFEPSISQESGIVHLLSDLDLSPENVKSLIANYNIDSDVADSRGNTRLMISSANDQHEIIECMINLGANIECYNDDGFTPLNLTILRYICLLNDIKRWNTYLIPQVNLKFDIKNGDQDITLKNIQEMNFFQPENLVNMKFPGKYVEIEDTNSTLKYSPKTKKSVLDSVLNTILLLMNMGAKATNCFVPKPSIHLALMSMNPTILKATFEAGGSSSYTLSNKNFKLNLLHMAVIMPTNHSIIKCIEVLITNRVDPNSKALPMFSVFRHQFPWTKIINDKAKATMTPLDIFCLKENTYKLNGKFDVDEQSENELASMLYDVTETSNTFCGLKPIALAMLTGKLNLTEIFLNKDRTVVNKIIYGFGTLLILLVNPTYNFNLSHKMINDLLDLLLKSNSNPLKIVKISNKGFKGNIYEYCYMLTESKKFNQEKHLSNLTEIVEKLENAGRTILDIIYAKRAKDALIRATSVSDKKIVMLLWLTSDLGIKEHQVKVENETYSLNSQQIINNSNPHNQIYLTQVEILVCYECLKHLSTKIESCSSCYFALLCSENCKKQHKKHRCITRTRQHHLIKIQNKLNKSDMTVKKLIEKKSYSSSITHLISSAKSFGSFNNNYFPISLASIITRPSSLALLKPSKMLSLARNSRLSVLSRKSNNSFTDYTNNELQQTQKKIKGASHIIQKYDDGENNYLEGRPNNSIQIRHTESTIQYNSSSDDKGDLNVYSSSLLNDEIDTYINKGKRLKNKPEEKLKKSIEMKKWQNNNKTKYWKSNPKSQNRERNLTLNNQLNNMLISSEKMKNSTVLVKKFQNNYKNQDWKLNQKTQIQERNLTPNNQVNILLMSSEKMKKSTAYFVKKFQNNYKKYDWKLKQKAHNRERNFIPTNQLSRLFIPLIKYRMIRTPGCRRPRFMFICHGSYENGTILKD